MQHNSILALRINLVVMSQYLRSQKEMQKSSLIYCEQLTHLFLIGCSDGVMILKWGCVLVNAKTLFNISVTNWDYVIKCSLMSFKKDDHEKLPKGYYSAKKMLRCIDLG
ncbi:hypothetical protein SLE2022_231660 [Rubroshorea leprosula]